MAGRPATRPTHSRGVKFMAWCAAQGGLTAVSRKSGVDFNAVHRIAHSEPPRASASVVARLFALGAPLGLICPELAEALASRGLSASA